MTDWKNLTEAVGELDEEQVLQILEEFIASDPTEEEAQKAIAACQSGMNIVGDRFEAGEYFVGDLIFAGELLSQAIEKLKPIIGSAGEQKIGTIVLGTVHGDLHDIGKNIFRSMAEAAGFEVYDLGIDQPVEAFVEKVKEVKPDIVGMSGVLTLALEAMKETVDGLKEAGLRDTVKIIIGGNPVTKEVCEHVGADAWTTNAAEGVKICQRWVS
ncbi:Cobalamin B12-binding domain protein [Tepidanaerobacter acetatoxydans Re1]|uniref:Cobalamin B12-binding domain protein n=1 Tax=Tepidanaerobacter acetatoxydans (strain DSM 21804 / JCM 16047 / Re1) TaxID=1209989 RepID=F4LTG6_TEPAE|nr:cobalamin-dependent protein [Tepidanaerobacter acetatoxydans]AEE90497.1 cobalamin B12-binding domain protein [Tepidanaerobacter acetatoxydans Re1]CCP25005.1 Cobalamin B12-binding domain protein [Tepidanaerobacter acetatoxydans Re1]